MDNNNNERVNNEVSNLTFSTRPFKLHWESSVVEYMFLSDIYPGGIQA